MTKDISSGFIIFKLFGDEIRYLIIKSKNGVIGFPKGHIENGESELGAAFRETFEEVALKPKHIEGFKESISYLLKNNELKTSIYFIAESLSDNVFYEDGSIIEHEWLNFENAILKLQFEDIKIVFEKANNFILNL